MKKYLVRFNTTGGDYDKEWCHANSPEEAEATVRSEHWNYASTISVEEIWFINPLKRNKIMTSQAENSLNLYRGQDAQKIEQFSVFRRAA